MSYKLKRFRVVGFQSIEDLTLEFEQNGVYLITGLNNIGKSALMKAMRAHFRNKAHQQMKKDFIRDGHSFFQTESEDFDGNKVIQRRGLYDDYTLIRPDGSEEPFYKLERDVPEEIRNLFQFYTDPVSKEDLNYRGSDDDLLLVKTSGKETYDILQYAIKTTEINEGITNGNSLKKDLGETIALKLERIDALQEQISGIKVVDLSMLADAVNSASELDTAMMALSRVCGTYAELSEVEKKMLVFEQLSADLTKFNELKSVVALLKSFITDSEKLSNVSQRMEECEEIIASKDELRNLATVNKLVSAVAVSYAKLGDTDIKLSKGKEILDQVESMEDDVAVFRLVRRFIRGSEKLTAIDRSLSTMVTEPPVELHNYVEGIKLAKRILSTMALYRAASQKQKEKSQDIVELGQLKDKLLATHGYCPTCRQRYTGAHEHKGGAAV